jgi:hypothetical protein
MVLLGMEVYGLQLDIKIYQVPQTALLEHILMMV